MLLLLDHKIILLMRYVEKKLLHLRACIVDKDVQSTENGSDAVHKSWK